MHIIFICIVVHSGPPASAGAGEHVQVRRRRQRGRGASAVGGEDRARGREEQRGRGGGPPRPRGAHQGPGHPEQGPAQGHVQLLQGPGRAPPQRHQGAAARGRRSHGLPPRAAGGGEVRRGSDQVLRQG
jgi:hypothetical protein